MKAWIPIFILFTGTCALGEGLSWQQRQAEQEAVGQICRESENSLKIRLCAFDMLCEWIKSDGEYFVAADQLLKLLEKDPAFFFGEMKIHPESFQRWISLIQASSFRAPYLYTNVAQMETRRKSIVKLLQGFTTVDSEEEALKQKILSNLTSFKASEVD